MVYSHIQVRQEGNLDLRGRITLGNMKRKNQNVMEDKNMKRYSTSKKKSITKGRVCSRVNETKEV